MKTLLVLASLALTTLVHAGWNVPCDSTAGCVVRWQMTGSAEEGGHDTLVVNGPLTKEDLEAIDTGGFEFVVATQFGVEANPAVGDTTVNRWMPRCNPQSCRASLDEQCATCNIYGPCDQHAHFVIFTLGWAGNSGCTGQCNGQTVSTRCSWGSY